MGWGSDFQCIRNLAGLLGYALLMWHISAANAGQFENGLAAYKQQDYATALTLWRPLAEQGNADAQEYLGVMYANGQGVGKDPAQAAVWFSRAEKKRHFLHEPETTRAAAEIKQIQGGGDSWSYEGEVEAKPAATAACMNTPNCSQYCDAHYCAHGSGSLGTDGGLVYKGSFVHGRFEGFGHYETDFYDYDGEFKQGKFDGHGVLTCLRGGYYDGTFVAGAIPGPLTDEYRGIKRLEQLVGKPVGWVGPCER
jgi:hypothetical protein